MRILVIGGTLFIGRAIVERLASEHDVTVLHRRDRHDLGFGIRNVQADRGDLPAVTRILRDGEYDVVFDVAYDWGKGTSAAQVEAAARACGDALQRYVFVSSIAAYGPGLAHREEDALVGDDFPNPYSLDKASSERALFHLHASYGFPVTTFRPPFVHGPRQPFYREAFFWDRLLDERPLILPGDGHRLMQFVYVKDLVQAMVQSMEEPMPGGQPKTWASTRPPTVSLSILAWRMMVR